MKSIVSLFALVLSLSVPNSFAASSKTDEMKEVLNSYLKIQESLAIDSLDQVQIEATKISKKTNNREIKQSAQLLSRDATLEMARGAFKNLSLAMDKWAKTTKPEGIDRLTCPMAHASWLQKHGAIENPYYGRQMQGCGELQK